MKWTSWTCVLLVVALVGCSGQKAGNGGAVADEAGKSAGEPAPMMTAEEEKAALHKENPAGSYGLGLGTAELVPIATLDEHGAEHLGQMIRVQGTISEVCPMRGCWMDVEDESGNALRVKVTDGQIVFPLSAKGEPAVIEGVLTKIDMAEDEANAYRAHLAEEKGETYDPETHGSGPMVFWQLDGKGAVIGE